MAPQADTDSKSSAPKDPIQRGNKQQSPAGVATFVGLRLLDPFLQYSILAKGYGDPIIRTLGGTVLPPGPALVTRTAFDGLALSPYRSIILGMSVVAMLKHNSHMTTIMQERMEPAFAAEVGIFNGVTNTLNSLFFICAQTSASVNGETFPQTPLLAGITLFTLGISVELGSELQRHWFKKDPANKGKVYEGGLFALSRHINYFGYTLWRTGYAVACGGWIWGAMTAGLLSYAFVKRSIPALQQYLEGKYGEQYSHYKHVVPYAFMPYVY